MRRPLKRYREWNTFHKLTVVSLHTHRHGSAAQRHGIDAFHNNVRGHFVFRFLPYLFRTRNDIRVLLPDALPLLRPLSADAEMILDNHRHGRMIPRASFSVLLKNPGHAACILVVFQQSHRADRVVGDGPCFHAVVMVIRGIQPYYSQRQ